MSITWTRAIDCDTVARDGMAGVVVDGERIAIYCVDGAYFATSDICTHGQAQLSDGYLDDYLIECPLHQGMFDIRTGAAAGAPCSIAVQTFPVQVDDGFVFVGLPQSQ